MMAGIRWVSELIETVGGDDVFSEKSHSSLAKGRIVSSQEVLNADPEIYVGSWCGKGVKFDSVRARQGWGNMSCVKGAELHEIKSTVILQPGPALFVEGVDALGKIVADWCTKEIR